MRRLFYLVLTICCVSVSGMAQATARNTSAPPSRDVKTQASNDGKYVIGAEDVLSIAVWREPELSARVAVRPDGKIGVPFLDDVQASGLTPMQLQEEITRGLSKLVKEPQVSVIVLEIKSQVVYVTGAVGKAGPLPLGGPMTVMEALIRAGGLTEFAKSEEIQILRKEGDRQVPYRFNYKRFSKGEDYAQNIPLKNGDMIIVP